MTSRFDQLHMNEVYVTEIHMVYVGLSSGDIFILANPTVTAP